MKTAHDPAPEALGLELPRTRPSLGRIISRFLVCLPTLLVAHYVLRIGEWFAAGRLSGSVATPLWPLLWQDLLDAFRFLPILFLLTWPFLRRRSRHWWRGVAVLWSLWLIAQAMLIAYSLVTRVPLGADLFGYSISEIRTTLAGGTSGAHWLLWLLPSLLLLWIGLGLLRKPANQVRWQSWAWLLGLVSLLAWTLFDLQPTSLRWRNEGQRTLVTGKLSYFIENSLASLMPRAASPSTANGPSPAGRKPIDPAYPLLHEEQTPDVLGAVLTPRATPPHLVFVIIEGMGRSFSGPDARLGSFTPFLDELATRSLYFDNFIAPQGRTFGVLPSLFGSLPTGDAGFAELDDAMPPHASIFSVLRDNGYRTGFYAGFDLDFDKERSFLKRQGVQAMYGRDDYGARYPLSNDPDSWGHPDAELVAFAAEQERDARSGAPSVVALQTISMHTPYKVPDQDKWRAAVDARLDALNIPAIAHLPYNQQRDIYASVLYTDDALRKMFEAWKQLPEYDNTIFIITGDHALPEIPLADAIERFHVPLIIHSPMLKAPQRIRAVSSHFDVTPSLLAYLARAHGLRTPQQVAWLGDGLDLGTAFQNRHDIPLKPVKRQQLSLISQRWFLDRGQLYSLHDGLRIDPVMDGAQARAMESKRSWYEAINVQVSRDHRLMPETAATSRVTRTVSTQAPAASLIQGPALVVRDVRALPATAGQERMVEVVYGNDGDADTPMFTPLLVVTDAAGHELGESSTPGMVLGPGVQRTVQLPLRAKGAGNGMYYMSAIALDPQTSKHLGDGRYRVPVTLP